jgi:lipopolysaccharide export system protein LptC
MTDSSRLLRLFMLLAPVVALALGSFWLLEVLRRSADEAVPNRARVEPDFYVEQFSYVKLAPNGRAQYHFAGERLSHNPQDDSYDIHKPVIRSVSQGNNAEAPMIIRADRAHVTSDNSEVHMHDNVHMDRPASPTNEPLHVKSDYILILPDDDVMKTDKPVVITSGPSILKGVGMFANNATREFKLMSSVHGTYQPPAREIR